MSQTTQCSQKVSSLAAAVNWPFKNWETQTTIQTHKHTRSKKMREFSLRDTWWSCVLHTQIYTHQLTHLTCVHVTCICSKFYRTYHMLMLIEIDRIHTYVVVSVCLIWCCFFLRGSFRHKDIDKKEINKSIYTQKEFYLCVGRLVLLSLSPSLHVSSFFIQFNLKVEIRPFLFLCFVCVSLRDSDCFNTT